MKYWLTQEAGVGRTP